MSMSRKQLNIFIGYDKKYLIRFFCIGNFYQFSNYLMESRKLLHLKKCKKKLLESNVYKKNRLKKKN